MGTFKSSRYISTRLTELTQVSNDIEMYFVAQGYEVQKAVTAGGCLISLSKGGMFKSVLGMKTALNVDLRMTSGGIMAEAGVGIFGQQLIPTVISVFVAWPVLLTQIAGFVQQSKLDDEALRVVEESIRRNENNSMDNTVVVHVDNPGAGTVNPAAGSETLFCVSCGVKLPVDALFCPTCGTSQK